MHDLQIKRGEVIVTLEKKNIRLGYINKQKLHSLHFFGLPKGFAEDANTALENHLSRVNLGSICQSNRFIGASGAEYDLNMVVEAASPKAEMQWYVKEADPEKQIYTLAAIAKGREKRTADWASFLPLLGADELPDISDFLEVKNVDSSFFDKKAILQFTEL